MPERRCAPPNTVNRRPPWHIQALRVINFIPWVTDGVLPPLTSPRDLPLNQTCLASPIVSLQRPLHLASFLSPHPLLTQSPSFLCSQNPCRDFPLPCWPLHFLVRLIILRRTLPWQSFSRLGLGSSCSFLPPSDGVFQRLNPSLGHDGSLMGVCFLQPSALIVNTPWVAKNYRNLLSHSSGGRESNSRCGQRQFLLEASRESLFCACHGWWLSLGLGTRWLWLHPSMLCLHLHVASSPCLQISLLL